VAPCAVCTWHVETRSTGFLVEPQNQGRRFASGFASKPLKRFLMVWPQNQWRRFSPVWPQNWWRRFLPVWPENQRSVSWLSLKTKVVEGFPVCASKPTAMGLVIWASKLPRWFLGLGLKTKQALVCRLRHKTDGRKSAWDTRRDLVACLVWKQVWLGFSSLT
jgi:hypothetical protein